ncbi:MAG: hypothetical protein LBT75_05145 [Bacilli bacterium]|jgi:O-antigen ligase|nr:hypothetical protein [Bacilli bacterium]
MRLLKNFIKDFTTYSVAHKLIMGLAIILFLPYQLTILYIIIFGLFVLFNKSFWLKTKDMVSSYALLGFGFYLFVIANVYRNYEGSIIAVAMFLMFLVIIYYRQNINKELFEKIINIMIFLSVVHIVLACFEQSYYNAIASDTHYFFDISNKPDYRVHTFFENANYYALIVLMIEALCIYKMVSNKKNRSLYISVALLNIIPLYFTGSRIVWIGLIVTWLAMFVVSNNKKAISASISFALIMLLSIIYKIPLIPRFLEFGADLGRRKVIYQAAKLVIKDNWLLGQGPGTYGFVNNNYLNKYISIYGSNDLNYLGISSFHVHSLLLEPFVSYGVIGTILLFIYMYAQFRRIIHMYIFKVDPHLMTLIIGVVIAVFITNALDFSIGQIQTATLFFIILGSVDVNRQEVLKALNNKRRENHQKNKENINIINL